MLTLGMCGTAQAARHRVQLVATGTSQEWQSPQTYAPELVLNIGLYTNGGGELRQGKLFKGGCVGTYQRGRLVVYVRSCAGHIHLDYVYLGRGRHPFTLTYKPVG
jgi:hypothetical protein